MTFLKDDIDTYGQFKSNKTLWNGISCDWPEKNRQVVLFGSFSKIESGFDLPKTDKITLEMWFRIEKEIKSNQMHILARLSSVIEEDYP